MTVFDRLKDAAGAKGFSEDPNEIAPHLEEWRSKYQGRSPLLLKPSTTDEVSKLLAICNETGTPVVPQGGNTGLVGGQIPFNGEVLLSLSRMNRIRSLDGDGPHIIAEAGVVLATAQNTAAEKNFLFPLSLAAEGSCTIGGNVSTNAGGVNVLRYGMARDLVLGLEVVLADGRVLDLLRTLRKDNTGYDLKQLFIGSEGSLGIVTAAALKLFPKPARKATAFVAVSSPAAAVGLLRRMQDATGGLVSGFEFLSAEGLSLSLKHIPGTIAPMATDAPWFVLAEATGGAGVDLNAAFETALGTAIEKNEILDAVLAATEAQAHNLWRVREGLSEAQKREGASIKHDVSVPIADLPAFLEKATAAVRAAVPGARPVPFGHLGDGNIHFNISAPKNGDADAFLARWDEVNRLVHDIVRDFNGSISAEHGIGVMKRDSLPRYKSAVEIDVMRSLKHTLDPKNILNPGKVLMP